MGVEQSIELNDSTRTPRASEHESCFHGLVWGRDRTGLLLWVGRLGEMGGGDGARERVKG